MLKDLGLVNIHHVGSTSIEGLIAKPIIDMCIEIETFPPSQSIINSLENSGYINQGEAEVPGRIWLIKGTPREFHIHVTPKNGEVCKGQLKFRDRLRESNSLKDEYTLIKMKFQGHNELDSHEYNLSKSPFVEKVLRP